MNRLTKQEKLLFLGLFLLIIAVAIFLVWFLNPDRKVKEEIRNTLTEQEVVKAKATEALKSVVDIANQLSGITSGAVFNFEVTDVDGRSGNFGIVRYIDEVKGERIVEEHFVTFKNQNYASEVHRDTNAVVSMHRSVSEFAVSGSPYPVDKLEETVRQFVERVYPEFTRRESTLEYDPGSKDAPGVATNYFFRWNDKQFAVPNGLEMDLPPFIQVGINANGFIFSYENTVQLYHNLPKEALRAMCGFVEMPRTDDSLTDREKGIVKVWFTEYEPFQNRYLILPYEPETDFEGCSESAKEFLGQVPSEPR
ncbi:MAG: hypothetical protein A3G49_03840 [Candidatus Sungbacteria bacterium RIFCSPLOWO2_12_FULL_41_11]|uniref:Uncharacterized protein n=1 Tax=Candidatus Sungbacteria bacterium RIFCSPLOWO2_12_FULL_41_11 TaxID=1802286 RepID=A0A1G2LMF4_9BACT|nr:MAG: hypothetical protein UV01_C0016G0007 [Parcubacteria group bacterium GW2011_GWA2_42_14]OHA00071.1 MAG: hypothetical protein A3D41_03950 [Candidatus Sungbacteria bacterium RIFCSPHIGHO2_02_FULL_41_12b]OHA12808.1 MAG: hypothetical protein A3G49_03840 [Candidatus Sungbacteria bacterium RIFCSPLOWO2_12_FULL_41_11]